MLYEAKVIKMEKKPDGGWNYYVHYQVREERFNELKMLEKTID